jgi:hypothetical protein
LCPSTSQTSAVFTDSPSFSTFWAQMCCWAQSSGLLSSIYPSLFVDIIQIPNFSPFIY